MCWLWYRNCSAQHHTHSHPLLKKHSREFKVATAKATTCSQVKGYRRGSWGHCAGLVSPGRRPPPSSQDSSESSPSWPESLHGEKTSDVRNILCTTNQLPCTQIHGSAAHLHALQTWGWTGFVCRTWVRFCTACVRNISVKQRRAQRKVSKSAAGSQGGQNSF